MTGAKSPGPHFTRRMNQPLPGPKAGTMIHPSLEAAAFHSFAPTAAWTRLYTGCVCRFVAAFVLALIASLAAVDPVLCPDGCSDNARALHPGACLSCQHGIITTELENPISTPIRISLHPETPVLRLMFTPSHAIDHPPRQRAILHK